MLHNSQVVWLKRFRRKTFPNNALVVTLRNVAFYIVPRMKRNVIVRYGPLGPTYNETARSFSLFS